MNHEIYLQYSLGWGLQHYLQTSHSLGWLEIIGECDVKITRPDGCIYGFDDGNNDSFLLCAALSTENRCVLGKSEGTTVYYWNG